MNFINWLAHKASRDTTSGQFIPEIDGLRFIAIIAVILFHLSGYVTNKLGRIGEHDLLVTILSTGHIGVQLFFVVSGFVIALPFAKSHFFNTQRPRLSQYLFRRLSRLEPPYIVNLLILYSMLVLVNGVDQLALFPHLITSIAYIHNIIYHTASTINVVAWSLEVELQFYVLAPLLTFLFAIRSDTTRRTLLVVMIISLSLFAPVFTGASLTIVPHARFFLSGFLLLDLYLKELPKFPDKTYLWDMISLCAWGAFINCLYFGADTLIAMSIIIAYYASFKGAITNRFFTYPVVYTVGGMCYSIYLYHYQLISVLGRPLIWLFKGNTFPIWFQISITALILTPLILLFCTLIFIFVEKPCMKRNWHIDLYKKISYTIIN
jgi:peptidoglycan/LPS O-acetylase OafA/YrhL